MEDSFEKMVLGNGTSGNIVPAFLMDDAANDVFVKPSVLHQQQQHNQYSGDASSSRPAFLDDDNEDKDNTTTVMDERGGRSSSSSPILASGPTFKNTDGLVSSSAQAASHNHAIPASSEELHLTGESGMTWYLRRKKILGKGNFGCATLYERRSHASTGPLLIVVKDVNIQTMTNREEGMASLRTEVDVLRRSMGHPSIVRFLDYYEDTTNTLMAYILLEYCGGGDLGNCIEAAQQKRKQHSSSNSGGGSSSSSSSAYLPEGFVASVLVQIIVALQFLHVEQGILHRDMKPQNVFLLDDGVTVRLGDFGVATVLGGLGEKAKAACGSPFYMAPELCAERAYDGEADIWSTGVLLYELMALERPFNAGTFATLAQLVLKSKCIPLTERQELPYSKELKDLVQSMLTVDPAARPTLRRLLRNAYVRRSLHHVPRASLDTTYYRTTFGDEVVNAALLMSVHAGVKQESGLILMNVAAATEEEEDEYEDDFEDE